MGRGRSSFGGGSSRGSSSWSSSSSRGRSSSRTSRSRTTVIIGGGHRHVSHHDGGYSTNNSVVGIVVGAFFAFFGLIMLLLGVYECSQVFRYAKTSAYCVGNEYSHGWYYALYDYTVDGKDYNNIKSNQGWEFDEEIGEKVTIYYLKSDPTEISEDCPAEIGKGIGEVVFAVVFGGIGVLAMVICIKQHKGSQATASNNESLAQAPVKEETHKVCEYCGSRYDKSLSSCPKCGAGK